MESLTCRSSSTESVRYMDDVPPLAYAVMRVCGGQPRKNPSAPKLLEKGSPKERTGGDSTASEPEKTGSKSVD